MSERDELTAMVNEQAERQFRELLTPEAMEQASLRVIAKLDQMAASVA